MRIKLACGGTGSIDIPGTVNGIGYVSGSANRTILGTQEYGTIHVVKVVVTLKNVSSRAVTLTADNFPAEIDHSAASPIYFGFADNASGDSWWTQKDYELQPNEETALDDPEHYSLDGFPDKLRMIIDDILIQVERLINTFDNGKILSEGINTVIVGKPNAGKSSLLNMFVGEDRAIVTDMAGTTRDTLSEIVNVRGITLNIIDTAGIRETDDLVEKIGVDKAIKSVDKADLVLYVVPARTAVVLRRTK